MTYTLHPAAEQDVADAMDFYLETAGFAVADRFLKEFRRVMALVVEYPQLGMPAAKGRRIFPLRTFPYSVVYRDTESQIRILIVRHQNRKPTYGGSRA